MEFSTNQLMKLRKIANMRLEMFESFLILMERQDFQAIRYYLDNDFQDKPMPDLLTNVASALTFDLWDDLTEYEQILIKETIGISFFMGYGVEVRNNRTDYDFFTWFQLEHQMFG